MPKLFRPMEHAHRGQIKIRAAAQNREMTKKSVKKGTQKKQVYSGKIQKQIQQKKNTFILSRFASSGDMREPIHYPPTSRKY